MAVMASSATACLIQKSLAMGLILLYLLLIIYIVIHLLPYKAPWGRILGLHGWSDVTPQPCWTLGLVASSFSATLELGSWGLLWGRLRAAHPALAFISQ